MPNRTYACARPIASLMLALLLVISTSCEGALAHGLVFYRQWHPVGPRGPILTPHFVPRHVVPWTLPPRPVPIDPTKFEEMRCLSMNAYFESVEAYGDLFESMFMIAFVTKYRADESRANEEMRLWFIKDLLRFVSALPEHSLCMATYSAWQFSWTMAIVCPGCQKWIQLQNVPDPAGYKWEYAQDAAEMVMEGYAPKDIGLDPELSRATDYFNPDATKPLVACEFFYKTRVRLMHGKRLGGHLFFAIPTPEEKLLLAKAHEPERIQIGVTKRGSPIWKMVSHTCDIVDALPTQLKETHGH